MPNASDVLIETLQSFGVDTVFGLPGDGINGIMEALRARQDRIRFIQVRHEESAAFMACAYAKYTGRLGVCLATSGPGGLHLINGLYDAKLDGQPVLAITGHTYHDMVDTMSQQDVDLDRVFADVALYSARVMGPSHMENAANLACRTALSRRGVAHLNVPLDIQTMSITDGRSKRNRPEHSSAAIGVRYGQPPADELQRAADLLADCSRVAILAGRGALGAGRELEAIADHLGAPIVKALLGKAAVADDSPFTTGGLGLLGTRPSQDALARCDGLLIAGSSFPYIEFLPKPGQARCVQIDVNPARMSLRCPVDVALVGDAACTLAALLPRLGARREDRSFLEDAQDNMRDWREMLDGQADRQSNPMKPQTLARAISDRITADAIVSCDSGTSTIWWARLGRARGTQMHSVSGMLASMACAVPYAIAAQLAHPGRQCVAFAGDGAVSMLMGELATAVKYALPIRIIVLKNNTLGHIKWEQMAFLGNPEYACELQPIDFAAVARACGMAGFAVSDSRDLNRVLDEAFAVPGPALIEATVDPLEVPLPPKVNADQAAHFAEALLRGEPDAGRIIGNVVKETVREMI